MSGRDELRSDGRGGELRSDGRGGERSRGPGRARGETRGTASGDRPEFAGDTERDARPPRLAVALSLGAATLATLAAVLAAPIGGAVVGLSVAGYGVGLVLGSSRLLSWGAGAGVVGVAVAVGSGGGAEPLLIAAVALAVGWDVADHGLSVGRHVGREGRTRRNVAVHAGSAVLVGTLSAVAVYGTYVAAAGGQPVAALALLLFGAVVLASAFR